MKKLLPLVAAVGVATLLITGYNNTKIETTTYEKNLIDFTNSINELNKINNETLNINRYNLNYTIPVNSKIDSDIDERKNIEYANLNENNNSVDSEKTTDNSSESELALDDESLEKSESSNNYSLEDNENLTENNINLDNANESNTLENDRISTLYSLSSDITNECDEFCKLKENLQNAIKETQNLIEKVKNNEISLTNEQKMFITEQSNQLKSLGRNLAKSTTELSIELSDINKLLLNNGEADQLSLKYLIVLDNLINGNELLENSLNSLNLINTMFNMSNLKTNTGRFIYGYQQNGQPPVIKDYQITENGELKENNNLNQKQEDLAVETTDSNENTNKKPILPINVDTYGNTMHNIDSFYNTALFDNDFMYGGNAYGGYPYMNNMMNPNYQQILNYENTQKNNEKFNKNSNFDGNLAENQGKKDKKIKFSNNIDTYKDENTPSISTRFNNFKKEFSNFKNKFSKENKEKFKK